MLRLLLIILLVPIAAVMATSMVWLPLLFWYRERQAQRRAEALAAELGAGMQGAQLLLPAFAHGCTLRLEPSRNAPWVLEVAIPDPGAPPLASFSSPRILLRSEGWADRLGKRLELNREVQIGEPDFDRAVYIESDAPDHVVACVLGDPARRRAVLDVLAAGFAEVRIHDGSSLVAASRPRPGAVHLRSAVVRDVARCLAVLAPAIPAREPLADAVPAGAGGCVRGAAVLLLGLAILAGLLGAAGVMVTIRDAYPPVTGDVYLLAVPVGASLVVVALLLLALAVRGRSTSFRVFVMVGALIVYAVPCYTVGAFLGINGAGDISKPALRPSRVVDRWATTGKNAGRHLRLAGLRRGDAPFELEVDASTYDKLAAGNAVVVTTGAGALGWEWIRRIDPAPKR